jgi:hypothetical protein
MHCSIEALEAQNQTLTASARASEVRCATECVRMTDSRAAQERAATLERELSDTRRSLGHERDTVAADLQRARSDAATLRAQLAAEAEGTW